MSPQDNSAIVTAPQSEAAAFGTLPGEFAIRTRLKNTFLTARDGGHHTIDVLITSATTIGPNGQKFRLTSFQPDFITLQTPLGFVVSAIGGGELGGDHHPTQILQTERTTVADDALFRLIGRRRQLLHSDAERSLAHRSGRRRQNDGGVSYRRHRCERMGVLSHR